jgi:uncharacterized membrane protein YkvA (DUF1232 family)
VETWLWALVAAISGLVLTGVVAWWLLRRFARPPNALVERIGRLTWRRRLSLAVALVREPRIPLSARLVIPAVLLYLVLPLDIIPDFIPVIGALDDILVVLIGFRLLLRSVPEALLEEHLSRLEQPDEEPDLGERPTG